MRLPCPKLTPCAGSRPLRLRLVGNQARVRWHPDKHHDSVAKTLAEQRFKAATDACVESSARVILELARGAAGCIEFTSAWTMRMLPQTPRSAPLCAAGCVWIPSLWFSLGCDSSPSLAPCTTTSVLALAPCHQRAVPAKYLHTDASQTWAWSPRYEWLKANPRHVPGEWAQQRYEPAQHGTCPAVHRATHWHFATLSRITQPLPSLV